MENARPERESPVISTSNFHEYMKLCFSGDRPVRLDIRNTQVPGYLILDQETAIDVLIRRISGYETLPDHHYLFFASEGLISSLSEFFASMAGPNAERPADDQLLALATQKLNDTARSSDVILTYIDQQWMVLPERYPNASPNPDFLASWIFTSLKNTIDTYQNGDRWFTAHAPKINQIAHTISSMIIHQHQTRQAQGQAIGAVSMALVDNSAAQCAAMIDELNENS